MTAFTINNTNITSDKPDKLLIDFLRDEMRLTSVKEGCGEGACGTCMVLVDGKAKRACLLRIKDAEGKSITTVEGLSKREKDVYSHCFAAAGAVQCGFCIPGMVICAKALLDEHSSPDRAQVKKAIHGNICRCTGYIKIEDAILSAAEFLSGKKEIPQPQMQTTAHIIGESIIRDDAASKTLGTGLYTDDINPDNMVHAKALRSKYPRAKVLSIDTAKAAKHPDCIRIITAADVPGNIKCGHIVKDWDAFIAQGGITRYIGDALALAVTGKKESLDDVLALIAVEYEELTPMSSPRMSLEKDAPALHGNGNILFEQVLKRGNADTAIKESEYVASNHYSLPFTEHAFMEPECAVAVPDGSDSLTVYTGSQSIYDEQREISSLLGIPCENIRVRSMLTGGAFGGKEDMSVQHHAALAAWLVKRPVKVKLSRAESISVHPKRHAMEIDMTTACDKNGIITAVKAEIISDTGAYASLGGPVLQRACTHAAGPYNIQNVDIKGKAVYTNNPPAGAFRGFGVTQTCFAMESNLNMLAEKAGISPWEIRYRNAVRQGQTLPNGQPADDGVSLAECLMAAKDAYEKSRYTGIACGFKNTGLGVGTKDTGRCKISVEKGVIHIRCSAACAGQGMAVVLKQIVCETLGVPEILVIVEPPDTSRTPDSGTTTASRQTLFAGEAAARAAKEMLRAVITDINHKLTPDDIAKLEGCEFYGEYRPETDPINSDKQNPVFHVGYSYAVQVAELDQQGRLVKVTAAYDIGTVINPLAAEGQIEGGVLMGAGYALTEDFPLDECRPAAKYGTLGLIRALDAPQVETIFINKKAQASKPAYGAKGTGELASIPAAPAIAGALYRRDGVLRTKLPMKH